MQKSRRFVAEVLAGFQSDRVGAAKRDGVVEIGVERADAPERPLDVVEVDSPFADAG